MNKSDLMREIAKKMSISQKDSLRFINIFEDVMANELLKDGSYNDDWNCNTDYFNVKGSKYAVDLNAGVSTFVTSYAAGSKSYETVLNTLKKTWDAALKKR